jgi:hypothetical protein
MVRRMKMWISGFGGIEDRFVLICGGQRELGSLSSMRGELEDAVFLPIDEA